jgi:hypothetical protein
VDKLILKPVPKDTYRFQNTIGYETPLVWSATIATISSSCGSEATVPQPTYMTNSYFTIGNPPIIGFITKTLRVLECIKLDFGFLEYVVCMILKRDSLVVESNEHSFDCGIS